MSVHLVNKAQEEFGYSILSWYKVLNLAFICGWVPAGTLPPADWDADMEDWDGRYHTSDGQWITAEDAERFAGALEAGLDDIPDMDLGESIPILPLRLMDADEGEDSIERVTR